MLLTPLHVLRSLTLALICTESHHLDDRDDGSLENILGLSTFESSASTGLLSLALFS